MASGSDGGDYAALAREYAELRPVVEQIDAYRQLLDDMAEAKALLKDPEMAELAQEVIALSGKLKRPEAVPGLVTAREQAQRDPPPPPWQRPSSAPVPPQEERAPGGPGRLGTPSKRPAH